MVSHRRLQNYNKHYAMGCLTGSLGCRWHRYQQSTESARPCHLLWFWFLVFVSGYIFFWFYFWLLAENSLENLNWYAYQKLGKSIPAYTILFALTCVTLAYVFLLDVLALCHLGHGHQIYIHWSHRTFLVLILATSVIITIVIDSIWKEGWQLQKISVMITGPFLHVAVIALMTFLTWFISGWFLDDHAVINYNVVQVVRIICFAVYGLLMIFLYLSPLLIRSPCITQRDLLPQKPRIVAHKGASSIAPENTLIAFDYATRYNVLVLESDVSISFDGIPFMLHDNNLERTTNVADIFPNLKKMEACWFNMSQLKQLDAGSWFIKNNPFPGSLSLTEDEKSLFKNQTIPELGEFLHLASRANTSVMFDIKFEESKACVDHPFKMNFSQVIVDTISQSGFQDDKMWWLYYNSLNVTTNYTKVCNNRSFHAKQLRQSNVFHVNFGFNHIAWDEISVYNSENISVNMYVVDSYWLFSLYWCMGVVSMTTNKCQMFDKMERPVWHLTPKEFLSLWLTTDIVSLVIIIIIWVAQKLRRNTTQFDVENISLNTSNAKIVLPSHTMKEKLLISRELVEHVQEPDIDNRNDPNPSSEGGNSVRNNDILTSIANTEKTSDG